QMDTSMNTIVQSTMMPTRSSQPMETTSRGPLIGSPATPSGGGRARPTWCSRSHGARGYAGAPAAADHHADREPRPADEPAGEHIAEPVHAQVDAGEADGAHPQRRRGHQRGPRGGGAAGPG